MYFGFDQCVPRECFPREVLGLVVRIIHQQLLGEKLRKNGQTPNCRGPKDRNAMVSVIVVDDAAGLQGRDTS